MAKRIITNRNYLLHWKANPTTWDDDLNTLIAEGRVIKRKGNYYTIVTAHYSGTFEAVDCTCDKDGNYYPIYTEDLMSFSYGKKY